MLLINTKHTRVAIIGMATLVFVYGADRFLMKLKIHPLVAILLILMSLLKILPAFLMGKYAPYSHQKCKGKVLFIRKK